MLKNSQNFLMNIGFNYKSKSFILCSCIIKVVRKFTQHASSSSKSDVNYAQIGYMNAWQTDGLSGLDNICLSTIRVPPILKPNEILVKVYAASVNPLDIATIYGYGKQVFGAMKSMDDLLIGSCDPNKQELPFSVGRDFAGEVVRVGQNASAISVNDKVWGIVSPHKNGSHAEYVIAEACNVCMMPKSASTIGAASIPYAALTGWSAAVVSGGMKPNNCYGTKILVIGASGGVGVYLTQLLSAWGAEVVGVCSKDASDLLHSCGVSEVFDYEDPQTKTALTAYPSFNLIIDASGSPDTSWAKGLRRWQNASYVSLSSPLLKNSDDLGLVQGFAKSFIQILEENMSNISDGRFIKWAYFMPNQWALREITKMVSEEKIKPVVQQVFGFENTVDAYRKVLKGHARGKTVIDFSIDSNKQSLDK